MTKNVGSLCAPERECVCVCVCVCVCEHSTTLKPDYAKVFIFNFTTILELKVKATKYYYFPCEKYIVISV